MISDSDFLKIDQVLGIIKDAVEKNNPFSLVRVGDGENLVLAQDSVMPIKNVLKEPWAKAANAGRKGVTLPNLKLRDEIAESLKKADMVGIPFLNNDPIIAAQSLKRPLTEAVFEYFNIQPRQVCHTFVNRVLAQKKDFWLILKGRKILLLGEWAQWARLILKNEPYRLNITLSYSFTDYKQMDEAIARIIRKKDMFDIALVSCGVNAVILSQKISELTEKIAIDFGKSLMFMVQKRAGLMHSSYQSNSHMLP